MAENPEIDSIWPKAMHERYFIDDPEISSIGKWRLLSSRLSLKKYETCLNVYIEENGLSKWIKNCSDIHVKQKKIWDERFYDLLIMYDVIDHLADQEEVVCLLKRCTSFLNKDGEIFLLCHPGISRLGTHLTHINRAYIHLFFDIRGRHTIMTPDPISFYRDSFGKSMLKIIEEHIYKEYIEDYFDSPTFDQSSKVKLGPNHEIQFVAYRLAKERIRFL